MKRPGRLFGGGGGDFSNGLLLYGKESRKYYPEVY